MKVLRVIGSMDPKLGGPGQGVRNTVPALKKLGVENEVVTLDDPRAAFLGQDPFTIHPIGPASGPWQYGARLKPWLIDNMGRFDIIIVEGLWQYYGHATSQAYQHVKNHGTNKKLPKLLVMTHGMLDPYFQRAPDRRLKAMRNWLYWKLIESKVVNNADGLLFTCEEELLLARQPFRPYSPKRELNIGFGIQEPPMFDPMMRSEFLRACPQVDGRPYLLFLSRIHEKKGIDLLIDAYARTFSDQSPKLVIAGPGLDTPYGQQIQKLVTEKGMTNSIIFPGMLSGNLKWGSFYGCEAFILPSHQENFGIAVVEALACSKPVLISNQVNIWKEIINEGGGLVADDTLQGTMQLLQGWNKLTSPEKSSMNIRARKSFEKLYAIEPAAQRMLKTFQQINL